MSTSSPSDALALPLTRPRLTARSISPLLLEAGLVLVVLAIAAALRAVNLNESAE